MITTLTPTPAAEILYLSILIPVQLRASALEWPQDLVAGDSSRQFTVESIEFLNQDRGNYVDGSGNFQSLTETDPATGLTTTTPYDVVYRTGSQRSLIRITVVGSITQNGRTSTARIAREFEVVPKCCKRSFGRNVFGGQNWGRDTQACGAATSGPSGLIAGMNGGVAGGSNNTKQIVQEDGSLVTEAACWNGNVGSPSDLTGTPNPVCSNGTSKIANISFVPEQFNYVAPVYAHPSGETPTAPAVSTSASTSFLYFDIARFNSQANAIAGVGQPASPTDKNAFSGIVLSTPSKSGPIRTRIRRATT